MKELEINGSIICHSKYNLPEKPDLLEQLKDENLKQIIKQVGEDIILVLGGDGTMLRAIRRHHDKELPFLGINYGHKGFLLNSKKSIIGETTFIKRPYPLLSAEIKLKNGILKEIAVNEIDIRSASGKIISLDISISNKQNIQIDGDGIIIATPAGSTGYNSSLGGTILPHTTPTFVMTAKAPFESKKTSTSHFRG